MTLKFLAPWKITGSRSHNFWVPVSLLTQQEDGFSDRWTCRFCWAFIQNTACVWFKSLPSSFSICAQWCSCGEGCDLDHRERTYKENKGWGWGAFSSSASHRSWKVEVLWWDASSAADTIWAGVLFVGQCQLACWSWPKSCFFIGSSSSSEMLSCISW